ncbi:MAG: MarR family transcriptional regulator [Planctomycetales bacterium]|nr:MarR family transcriptional regulator [Planctomycetales bacterium]
MSTSSTKSRSSRRTSRFDSAEQEAFLNLWRTYDRLKLLEEAMFAEFDLSAQQYNALRLLRSVHPQTMPTLAIGSRLISRAPDMTRLLDKLEQRGLLVRERKRENRRVVEVGLTQAGLALLEELDGRVQECHNRQLGHMPSASLKELTRLLREARRPHEDAANPSLVDH